MANYAKSNGKILITDLVLKGQSFEILPVQDGIKSADKLIDFADNGTTLQSGDYSAADYAGGIKLTDKVISVSEIFVKEKYRKQELQAKTAQMAMKAGSSPEDLPFQDVLVGLKGDAIAAANEKLLWQGDVASADVNLKHFNGFLTQLKAASDVFLTETAAAELTKSTAVDKVEAIVEKAYTQFPEWIDVETRLFMSPKNFTTYFRALNKLNSAVDKQTNEAGVVKEVRVPGTNCIVTSIAGLHGSSDLIMTRPENFVIGVDLKSEDEQFNFEYLTEGMIHRYFALYKLGASIARTAEVVMTGVTPATV